jgi:superfamily II DNA or RNA helicase
LPGIAVPLLGAKHPRERINDVEHESAGSFEALLTSLSNEPLTKGKQFERLVKWWLTQDPIWSRKIKNVWLWDEWPEYPGRDIGIDLVAEMTDGTLCAVQAKCFDEYRDIPKSELDSFISAASHRTYQHRLLVATTDGLSANAKRMLADQHVVPVMRSHLESSLDVWPASIDELSAPVQPKYSPRPHQNLAITDVTNGFEGNSRGQLIMACGTGKTLTALWIKETLTPQTTLVLVPSLNLLAQTLSEWAKNSLSPWQYLCVCSDDTVNRLDDQPISTVGDLPFEVTTNPADIIKFLSLGGERIIFSTYQSSAQVAKAQEQSGVSFDLVICDEAHRLTGKTDADYATVLDEKKIVGQKRLFMTATPRTYTTAAKTKAEDRGVEITSMDDEHVYGPVLHKLSFGEAIKQDLLSDYRVLIVGVTDPQVQDLIDRRELVSVNDSVNTDARTLAAHIGLAKATKDYNLKRTISFHSRIKSADQFAKDHLKILDWLPDSHKPSGNTWTGTISGAMNTGDRRRLIKQLSLDGEDRHALLTNARCLTEGVDVPSLDGVAFIDPRSSQVDIVQAVGRAIRKSKDKEIGTIVLPVLIPTDSNAEDAIEDTNFKPIWAILNALKSHDDDFAIELNDLRTELGRTGKTGELPHRLVEDLPSDIDSLLPGFSQMLCLTMIERSTSRWDWWLGLLSRFVSENNQDFPTGETVFEGHLLGSWISNQRSRYFTGKIETDQVQKLEALRGWVWSVRDSSWDESVDAYLRYVDRHGHGLVPATYIDGQIAIGNWVSSQRNANVSKKLSLDKFKIIDSLPFWVWDVEDHLWNKSYEVLREFVALSGSSRLSNRENYLGTNLGTWIGSQRRLFKQKRLSDVRIQMLEEFPEWSWDPTDENWNTAYKSLVDFVGINNRLPEKGQVHYWKKQDLSHWVLRQRKSRNRLTESQINMLESIECWTWDAKEENWNQGFADLITFANVFGTSKVPTNYKTDSRDLYQWVQAQRITFRNGKMTTQRIELLNCLQDHTEKKVRWYWEAWDEEWETAISALKKFADREGHTRIPMEHIEDGFNLYQWVLHKRNLHKRRKSDLTLNDERIAQLEALPGWTWNPHNQIWLDAFKRLAEHLAKTGQCHSFPSTALRNWVLRQRQEYEQGNLDPLRISQLESLKEWTWTDPRPDSWDTALGLLNSFVKREGRRPKGNEKENGFAISAWCGTQRKAFAAGTLSSDKVSKLEAVPDWEWDSNSSNWFAGLEALKLFVDREGHARIKQPWFEGDYRLDTWAQVQRRGYESRTLPQDKIDLIEQIPGWAWDVDEFEWRTGLLSIAEFAKREGHTRLLRTHVENGFQLGAWTRRVRLAYNKGTLTQNQIDLLENVTNWNWNYRKPN